VGATECKAFTLAEFKRALVQELELRAAAGSISKQIYTSVILGATSERPPVGCGGYTIVISAVAAVLLAPRFLNREELIAPR